MTDIPYQNDNMSLIIISPASLIESEWKVKDNISNTDLLDLTARLSTSGGIDDLYKMLEDSRTSNSVKDTNFPFVPNFEVEKDLPMQELLQSLAIEQLLKSDKTNLNVADKSGRLGRANINYAVHRSSVKATMKELVVGARTVIHSVEGPALESKIVNVNNKKPFVWLIYYTKENEILSVGSCNNAESNCHIKPHINQPGPSGVPPKKRRCAESS